MAIPFTPLKPGAVLKGGQSWYGGAHDAQDNNRPALSGATNATPGIAVLNRATLGHWWLVQAPNGQKHVVQQTDLGPSSSTGRVVDYNYTAVPRFGYSEGNFPTGSQGSKLTYLGADKSKAYAMAGALGAGGEASPQPKTTAQAASGVMPSPTVDTAAYGQARKEFVLGNLLRSQPGAGDNPLLTLGVLPQTAPDPAAFVKQQAASPLTQLAHVQAKAAAPVSTGNQGADAIVNEASRIDREHTRYLYGGGHAGGKVNPTASQLDCSAGVSLLVQKVDPHAPTMTSGELAHYGAPGPGKTMTIYANDGHTFAAIKQPDGSIKYWGTSGMWRPAGSGPGWFTGTPGQAYLSNFSVRHIPGH